MRKFLKILNPFIWFLNMFCQMAHLHMWAERQSAADEYGGGRTVEYEPYDFSKDLKYF